MTRAALRGRRDVHAAVPLWTPASPQRGWLICASVPTPLRAVKPFVSLAAGTRAVPLSPRRPATSLAHSAAHSAAHTVQPCHSLPGTQGDDDDDLLHPPVASSAVLPGSSPAGPGGPEWLAQLWPPGRGVSNEHLHAESGHARLLRSGCASSEDAGPGYPSSPGTPRLQKRGPAGR